MPNPDTLPQGAEQEARRLVGAAMAEARRLRVDLSGNAILQVALEAMRWAVHQQADGEDRVSDRIRREERLPTLQEAADAAMVIKLCNGHDLDVWTAGEWPNDDCLDACQALIESARIRQAEGGDQ